MIPFDAVHVAYSPFPADPRVRREVVALTAAGLSVAVIALAGPDPAGEAEWNGVTIIRIAGTKRRGTFGQYVIEYGGFLARTRALIRRDQRLRSARVLHVHSLPDFLVFAAAPAKSKGARVVLDLHEILPEFAAAKFHGRVAGPARWLGLRIERASRRFADATITVNRPIEKLLRARPPHAAERLVVLHNAPDARDFGPPREPVPRDRLVPLRLVYHGTLTRLYGLDMAIDAVRALALGGVPVSLDIFGDGPDRASLGAKVREQSLSEVVHFHDPVSAQTLREVLPTYDAGIVSTRADLMTQYSLSTKLLEYIQLGIPAVAPTLMTYQEYFSEEALHYYSANDSTSLARTLSAMIDTPSSLLAAKARRAQATLAAIAWEIEEPRLISLYQSLMRPVASG